MEINKNILIIGPPNSGKTTFIAQLYARISDRNGILKLSRAPKNISGIENAYDRLADGEETQATPANENLELVIPVQWNNCELELTFKDYGGEQVTNMIDSLAYDKNWQSRAKENDRWILFIRPNEIYHPYDLTKVGYADIDSGANDDRTHHELSQQYVLIELIQLLLHARKRGIKLEMQSPKLIIVLTCWDELGTALTPTEIFTEKLPLFKQFIDNLWAGDSRVIVGLSAQEFRLDTPEAKERYQIELPESFGYLVTDEVAEERDLTRLIDIALKL